MIKTPLHRGLWMLCAALAVCGPAYAKDKSAPPEGEPRAVFDQPAEKVQKAAVDALVVLGCGLKKQEPTYVEGKRTRKVGAFVGSGGETLRVWLDTAQPEKTAVRVSSEKTFLGMAGQKNWDDQIVAEMTKVLSPGATETPAAAPAATESPATVPATTDAPPATDAATPPSN